MRVNGSKAAAWVAAFALCVACALSCSKDTLVETRTVTMHVPGACAPGPNAYALYNAWGDFDPAVQQGRQLGDAGKTLELLPLATRALAVDVTDGALEWRGLGEVPASGDVDVLLWPASSTCELTQDLGPRTNATFGLLSRNRMLVVGGVGPQVPATFVVDFATGDAIALARDLLTPRTRSSVTAFGEGGLVAGGARVDGSISDNAEVYVPQPSGRSPGDFDRNPIALSGPRADHGAVVLATGETLLVGGVGTDGVHAVGSTEIVDPASRSARTQRLAFLTVPRIQPTVMRLASGEVLVAGGFDDQGNPVSTLEWLTADGSQIRRTRELVARKRRAFVSLVGGGALAVISPDPGETSLQNVWVISADGAIEAATPIAATPNDPISDPRLFDGARGSPLLWTGQRWLRWLPWLGAFADPELLMPLASPSDASMASPDPGLAVWIAHDADKTTHVTGLRFDTRGPFSPLVQSLLTQDTSLTSPDRLVLPAAVGSSISFDAERGLSLAQGASVFVSDATYASVDVDVDVDVAAGQPPLVVLRDERGVELEVGGTSCPNDPLATTLRVERRASAVTLNGRPCEGMVRAEARLSVGVRGASAGGSVRNLRVVRRSPP